MPSKNTNNYRQFLHRQRGAVTCPRCHQSVLIKDYEGHCTKSHRLNARLRCVWCDGKRSWKLGQKDRMVDTHIRDCLGDFLLHNCPPVRIRETSSSRSAPATYVRFDTTPKYEAMQLHHHYKHPGLHSTAYEHFRITPLGPPLELPFQHEGLNSIASYVRTFLERYDLDFYHIMVRAPAMNRFLEAFPDDDDEEQQQDEEEDEWVQFYKDQKKNHRVTFLPFSCWCDGGTERNPWFRQHRHMIAVAPKGTFQPAWNKIRLARDEKPYDGYRCRKCRKIETAGHLVNTIGYLGQRESACNFTFKKGDGDEDDAYEGAHLSTDRRNHFHAMKSVPRDFKTAAFLQWDGGIGQLLGQKFRVLDPEKFVHAPLQRAEGKWRVRYVDVPGVRLDLVLPVAKRFRPCTDRPTEHFVHLVGGRKFHFEVDPEWAELDDETWHRRQAEAGNLFHHALGEDAWWELAPHQQKHVNSVKPVWNRLEAAEEENARLKQKLEEKDRTVEEYKLAVADKDRTIEEYKLAVADKDRTIEEYKLAVAGKDRTIEEKDRILEEHLKRSTERASVSFHKQVDTVIMYPSN